MDFAKRSPFRVEGHRAGCNSATLGRTLPPCRASPKGEHHPEPWVRVMENRIIHDGGRSRLCHGWSAIGKLATQRKNEAHKPGVKCRNVINMIEAGAARKSKVRPGLT